MQPEATMPPAPQVTQWKRSAGLPEQGYSIPLIQYEQHIHLSTLETQWTF